MSIDITTALEEFADACIRCGLCARTDCGNYGPDTPPLGDICESLLAGEETYATFPFTCALCNRCTVRCPVDLVCSDMVKPARAMLLAGPFAPMRDNYRHFRTDLKYNLFSLLQGQASGDVEHAEMIHGEADLGDEANATAFFAGCSLSSYAPALTAKTFAWLREQGIAARMLTFCCGATFYDTGFFDEFEAYRAKAARVVQELGIRRLVVACPHCFHILPDMLEGLDVELVRLPELLAERGVKIEGVATYSMHDACYDRMGGQFGDAARTLLTGSEERPMAHERSNTICCGGGGMVSAYAPSFCEYRRNMRLAEMDAVDSDCMVSTCFSCVNSLQRGVGTTPVKHYLELVFGEDVDWNAVYASVDAVYADPKAAALLASDTPLFGGEED